MCCLLEDGKPDSEVQNELQQHAKAAYMVADAMLKVRER